MVNRLNLAALRANRLPRPPAQLSTLDQLREFFTQMRVSRRQFLKTAGFGGTATMPIVHALSSAACRFDMVGNEKRLAFLIDGVERWVIDPSQFSGKPQLSIKEAKQSIALQFENAFFPGTDFPSDFACEITRGSLSSEIRLRLGLAGFRAKGAFEKWLQGSEPLLSRVRLGKTICPLGVESRLEVSGRALAEFYPNWIFGCHGREIASIIGLGKSLHSDTLSLSLLDPSKPSLLDEPLSKRSLVAVSRGDHTWHLEFPEIPPATWNVTSHPNAFEEIRIEAGETHSGDVVRALVAEGLDEQGGIYFAPSSFVANSNPNSQISLRGARFAQVFDKAQQPWTLVANIPSSPTWIHLRGLSLHVNDKDGRPPFELLAASEAKQVEIRFDPNVSHAALPIEGALSRPASLVADSRIEFKWTENSPETSQTPSISVSESGATEACLPLAAFSVLRASDLLCLRFELSNICLKLKFGKGTLQRTNAAMPAYFKVEFPPQHIADRAYFEVDNHLPIPKTVPNAPPDPDVNSSTEKPPDPPISERRISAPSRLVFEIGKNVIPFRLKDLLNWQLLDPVVSSLVLDVPHGQHPRPTTEPGPFLTAIEAPYRLVLSPGHDAGWSHLEQIEWDHKRTATQAAAATDKKSLHLCRYVEPVESKRTELWHTRLGTRCSSSAASCSQSVDDQDPEQKYVRAIWSWDLAQKNDDAPGYAVLKPFRMSLSNRDRHELVRLTSDYGMKKTHAKDDYYVPLPVQVQNLMLSSQGAWLDLNGHWIPPGPAADFDLSVEAWRHRAVMARDSYVRIAYKGFLFPLGIRASLLKVSERKFQRTSKRRVAGYLRQRMFIVIREPVKAYPAVEQPNEGRHFPFRTLRMNTLVTPNLDLPDNSDIKGLKQAAFWPSVGHVPFRFHVTAEDSCEPANDVNFTVPLIFVQNPHCFDDPCHPVAATPGLSDVFDAYYAATANRTVDFAGQKFCYAPSKKSGDTLLETQSLLFGAEPPDSYDQDELVTADQPAFYPCLEQAGVHVASIEQLTGGRRSQPIQVYYHPKYVDAGFAVNSNQSSQTSNKGEVFVALVDPLPLSFNGSGSSGNAVSGTTDKGGGVVTPNMSILGLSRLMGPVAGTGQNPKPVSCWPCPAPEHQDVAKRDLPATTDPLGPILNGIFDPSSFFNGLDEIVHGRLLGVISLSDVIPVLGDITDQLEKIPRLLGQLESDAIADIKAVRDDILSWIKNNLEQPAKIVDGYLFAVSAKQLIAQQISVTKGKVDADISSLAALAQTFGKRILKLPSDLQTELQQSGVPLGLSAEDLTAFNTALQPAVSGVSKLLSSLQTSIDQLFSDLANSFQARQATGLTGLVTKIEGELQNFDAVGVFNDLVNLPGSLKSQIENSLQYGTLFPEGRTLLYQQVQGVRNLVNTAANSATAVAKTTRKILDEDIQQLRRVANKAYQNAIDAAEKKIRAELDSIESDIEKALSSALQNVSTYFDAIWNQIVSILAAITDPKVLELIARLEEIRDQINAFREILSKPVQLTATLNWTPTIHNYPESGPAIFELTDLHDSRHHLNLAVKVTANVQLSNPAATQAHYSVDGSLVAFQVHLLPPIMDLIVVPFDSLEFHAQDGAKANIVPHIGKVQFVGVLEFVQTFQDIIQGLNQDTGPYIDIEPTYIEAGLRLAIPDLSCGAFSLTNMNLSSALSVPLTGEPVRLRFSFSDLQNPCTLRVGIYGGSMYVGLAVGLDGIEKFEGSIEFGGSFDIGIAGISGTAFAHAGLYYSHSGQMSTLGGFFHAGGNFDLFDIASVYIDIFVGLMYETGPGRNSAYGEVTVSVSVSIGFFTFSYGFTYVKEVQGSGSGQQQLHQTRAQMSQHKLKNAASVQNVNAGQPPPYPRRVDEMLTEQDWEIYRAAFAA